MATLTRSAAGSQIDSRKLSASIVLTRMQGHIDGAICSRQLLPFVALLETMPSPNWIIDTLEISGFDPTAVSAGSRWFHGFKSRAGERIAFVSSFGPARMAVRALSFGVGLRVANFDTVEEARLHLEREPGTSATSMRR